MNTPTKLPRLVHLRVVRDALDQNLATSFALGGPKVSCRPGCAACCSQIFPVLVAEAEAIVGHLLVKYGRRRLWSVARRCRETLAYLKQATPEEHWLTQRPCVLLDPQKRCTAYRVRPATCRVHMVASPPEHCSPPWGDIDQFNTTRHAAKFVADAGDLAQEQALLPEALLKCIERLDPRRPTQQPRSPEFPCAPSVS